MEEAPSRARVGPIMICFQGRTPTELPGIFGFSDCFMSLFQDLSMFYCDRFGSSRFALCFYFQDLSKFYHDRFGSFLGFAMTVLRFY